MWNTDICWSFQMDFKATSIYICLWMVKALYRLFFQYNVNVLGYQNMLHVYDVKRFFYYALLYEAVSKIQLASDVIQSSS